MLAQFPKLGWPRRSLRTETDATVERYAQHANGRLSGLPLASLGEAAPDAMIRLIRRQVCQALHPLLPDLPVVSAPREARGDPTRQPQPGQNATARQSHCKQKPTLRLSAPEGGLGLY